MASSENQGLQIALIIFVLFTLVLSLGTFFGFRAADDARAEADANQQRATEFQTANAKSIAENNRYKVMLGVAEGATLEEVEADYTADVERYMSTFPEDKRTYRQALEYLFDVLEDRETSLAAETAKVEQLTAAFEAAEADKAQQVSTHMQNADQAGQDLTTERNTFNEQRNTMTRDNEELLASNRKLQDDLTTAVAEAATDKSNLEKDLRETVAVRDRIKDQRDQLLDPVFRVADGQIAWVNQATGTVWINVGRADALQRQTTFSIYHRDAVEVADPPSKGRIEVTQLLGDHLAEARILEDDITDPIVTGDLIYTPVWTPGRAESFALAGMMDLDGDNRNDRDRVRYLITRSGGVVDAELGDDGLVVGELTPDTRFLVVGDEPASNLEAFSEMKTRAKELGLEEISLDVFLDHIGFTDPMRVFRFGESQPEDYPVERIDGRPAVSRGYTAGSNVERFPRRPPPEGSVPLLDDSDSSGSAYDE